ncbi:alanine dehydrogenase [Agrobacterium tumefaciens]|uniref:alanine dehydrogenase n=1 Tax=Agrobacterium tumefaciens TaxID=358 RepID=A0AA44FBU2_AGRTU|nr:alanine dehydrogenase [Agrobacterium tumefaciens]NTB87842.1 alanine dehydrogenase [Agrobacterium tumefaciens]NTC32070.1 alanine dehydrogenase [Agrobacterium tumefaciens]
MKPSVSILKETRDADKRVILLPGSVRQFVASGFDVYVEKDAGLGLDIPDSGYVDAGAKVVSTEEAWTVSPFILKYKYPSPVERSYLCRPLHIAAHFYPGENYDLTQLLKENSVTAYSYEYFRADDGSFPLMTPDSEISGKLAVMFGARQLLSSQGGRGILLASLPGVPSPKVVVIGHGNVGAAAARTAAALGNDVTVFGHRAESLRRFQATVSPSVKCQLISEEALAREIPDADLVIGAVLISTYDTPALITEDLVRRMKKGSVIVDVTCGYGSGFMPTADRMTRLGAPPYEVHGVWHYKDPVMPTQVHRTSATAASNNHVPYLINLGRSIFDNSFKDPVSERAKFTDRGEIVHPDVLSDFALIEELAAKTNGLEAHHG